jgi:hypothetical protein
MPERDLRVLVGAAVLTAVGFIALALVGHAELVAYALPVAVVALPLLAGRFPGEGRLAQLRERRAHGRSPRPVTEVVPAWARRAARALPRGGRLIADSLAVRPPPSVALR